MKSCCRCGKQVSSGHILCPEYNGGHRVTLRYYIGQLAEELVLGHQDLCAFCVKGSCDSQQSGLTCRHFIKTFLLGKIKTYEHHLKKSLEEHAGQYAFLDCLRASRDNTAPVRDKLAAAFPQMNDYQLAAILSVWEDTLAV